MSDKIEIRLSEARPINVHEHAGPSEHAEAPHTHEEGQLYIVQNGLVTVETAGTSWIMPRDHIGWIPPGTLHGARVHGAVAHGVMLGWAVHLHPMLCASLPHEPAVFRMTPLLEALTKRIVEWNRSARDLAPAEQRLLSVFIDEIRAAPKERLRIPMPNERRLMHLAAGLFNDPADESTLDDWAVRIGMSRRNLTRCFREETGMSLTQWRQLVRLKRGVEMLSAGESVTTVASSLGYDSTSSFIALFRRAFGTTPARYVAQFG